MFKDIKNIVYHILILVLSAVLALSFPYTGKWIADNYLTYWSLIESEKTFLISVEIVIAVLLILFFNYLMRSWKDRKFSKMALNDVGLVHTVPTGSVRARRRVKRFKEHQGLVRDVLSIGSTGFNTFVNPEGDLHRLIKDCREAKIMLLNPFGEAAATRAKSMAEPDVTPEHFKEQIMKSIEFLRGLKDLQKNIRLKLYEDMPLFKLTILGDYLFMKYYHPGLDIREMPEFIFRHSANCGSLFHPLYQYFLSKWRDPRIPEYDFDADELVYRDPSGNEVKREKLDRLGVKEACVS